MIKRLFDILRGKRYLLYITKFDGSDMSYLFFNESPYVKNWYYKNSFTKYIDEAEKYTKKQVRSAQNNTLLNKYELF